MSARLPSSGADDLRARVFQFARHASTEITPHDEDALAELSSLLIPGTTVYVAHTPKVKLSDVVRVTTKVQKLGFIACAHIVARAVESVVQLRSALATLTEAGCDRILLIAGDRSGAGPFPSTLEILESDLIPQAGIRSVAIAGHPEGNQVIGPERLWDALHRKQQFATRSGVSMHLLTQFSFNPQAIFAWTHALRERGITLPVHVGLAGPAPLPKLIRYAMRCGVGASLRALTMRTSPLGNLPSLPQVLTAPDQMLIGLVRGRVGQDLTTIVKPHLFSFGGCVETARWMRAVAEGAFEIGKGGNDFVITR